MRKPKLMETLESRRLLAGTPVIALGPSTIYLNAVQGHYSTYELRVQNTGTKRLLLMPDAIRIKGDDPGAFQVTDFPSTGISMGVGRTINLTVQFTAPTNTLDIQNASVRVASSDPKHPVRYEPLRGLPTAGEGGSLEPSLQKVLNEFNLPIDSGETDVNNYLYPSTPSSTSDEIDAQTFVKAAAGDVTIKPLAVFTNDASAVVRTGYYTPGELDSEQYLWYVPTGSDQSVSPLVYGQTSFDPGSSVFGLVTQYPHFSNSAATANKSATVRNVYSERSLNATWDSNTSFNHFRVYPYVDAKGNKVANTYLVAEEEYTTAYDNQDLIFVVTNVKPAAAQPTLSYQNLTGGPTNDIMSFNTLENQNADVGNLLRTTNTMRLTNSGASPLTVTTSVIGDYSITSGGGTKIVLAPGAHRDVTVTFTATSGTDIHKGTLTLTSDDPDHPKVEIALLGEWQEYSEQEGPHTSSVEPTAQFVVNKMLGYTTQIPSKSAVDNGGLVSQVGPDEVDAQYFTAANSNAAVNVTELATFHAVEYIDSNTMQPVAAHSFFSWYAKGSPDSPHTILTDKADTGQMVLPLASTGSTVAEGSFDAKGATFGLATEPGMKNGVRSGEYSDYALNPYNGTGTRPSNFGQFLRFFIARDADGKVIPNTYIVLHDYNTSTVNYDFNDNIYLISNILPVGEMKPPITAVATRNKNGVTIDFTGPPDGAKVYGYNVYRSTTPDGEYALLTDTAIARGPNPVYTDYSARADTSYYYQITTLDNGGVESRPIVVMA